MKKTTKVITGFFVVAALVIAILLVILSNKQSKLEGNIFFYRFDCPHCKLVEEFMKENNVSAKFSFDMRDVSMSQANRDQFLQAYDVCKLDKSNPGVPLFYANGSCYLGDVDIIKFLNKTIVANK